MAVPERSTATISTASDDELITGEAVALNLRPTGFVLRGAGAAIDWIVYFGLWIAIAITLSTPLFSAFLSSAMYQALIVAALVLCVVVIPTTVELASRGRDLRIARRHCGTRRALQLQGEEARGLDRGHV